MEQHEISPSEAFNALVDAMGALMQVIVRHLPPEAGPALANDLAALSRMHGTNGNAASSMVLNDLADAVRTKIAAPDTKH
jgi:hypothetical protein